MSGENDKVEEVMKYVAPLPCARARCGGRRAGGKGLKISQNEIFLMKV